MLLAVGGLVASCADDDEPGDGDATESSPATDDAGSSDNSAADADGDSSEFCGALTRLDEVVLDSDPTPFLDGMRDLDDVAPDEIADATGRLVEFIDSSVAIGELEGDEREAALDEISATEADFEQAVTDLQTYAIDACPELGEALFGTAPDSGE